MQPRVSVILPVFNCQDHLAHAIQSVLEQDVPLELIIVDDGSTDNSSQIAQSFCDMLKEQSQGKLIRYIHQENRGVAAARNVGVAATSSEFLAFIDADDLWTSGKLKVQVEALSASSDVACVMGKIQMFFDKAKPGKAEPDKVVSDEETSGEESSDEEFATAESRVLCGQPYYCYVLGSAVVRRSAFNSTGQMDESMKITSDMEWFVRLREQFRVEKSDFVSLLYRRRPGSLTTGKGLKERSILSLLKQSLDRRRSASGDAGLLY